jgi:hypothetical protein
MLFPTEPDLVFGLVPVVPVLEGPDVLRGPFAFFLGEGFSVAARFGAGRLLLKLLLIDIASDPFIMCALPGRVFSYVKVRSFSGLELVFLEAMDARSKRSILIGTGLTLATGMREPPLWLFGWK